jgi:hypothetical protein
MVKDPYKVTYTFSVEHINMHIEGYPLETFNTLVFDGTDAHINVIVSQFETFLKAAGYSFDYLEVVKK